MQDDGPSVVGKPIQFFRLDGAVSTRDQALPATLGEQLGARWCELHTGPGFMQHQPAALDRAAPHSAGVPRSWYRNRALTNSIRFARRVPARSRWQFRPAYERPFQGRRRYELRRISLARRLNQVCGCRSGYAPASSYNSLCEVQTIYALVVGRIADY
jgi:hypothetical protein